MWIYTVAKACIHPRQGHGLKPLEDNGKFFPKLLWAPHQAQPKITWAKRVDRKVNRESTSQSVSVLVITWFRGKPLRNEGFSCMAQTSLLLFCTILNAACFARQCVKPQSWALLVNAVYTASWSSECCREKCRGREEQACEACTLQLQGVPGALQAGAAPEQLDVPMCTRTKRVFKASALMWRLSQAEHGAICSLAQLLLAFGGSPCEQGIDGAELCSSGVSECLAGLQHEQFVFHLSFTLKTKMMIMIVVSVSDLHELLNFLEKEGSCIVVLMENVCTEQELCSSGGVVRGLVFGLWSSDCF